MKLIHFFKIVSCSWLNLQFTFLVCEVDKVKIITNDIFHAFFWGQGTTDVILA